VQNITDRYVELYENITGLPFEKADGTRALDRVEENVTRFLEMTTMGA
jgi:phosphoribosylaminoimidazole-succinocarboxamide synthase